MGWGKAPTFHSWPHYLWRMSTCSGVEEKPAASARWEADQTRAVQTTCRGRNSWKNVVRPAGLEHSSSTSSMSPPLRIGRSHQKLCSSNWFWLPLTMRKHILRGDSVCIQPCTNERFHKTTCLLLRCPLYFSTYSIPFHPISILFHSNPFYFFFLPSPLSPLHPSFSFSPPFPPSPPYWLTHYIEFMNIKELPP